MKAGLKKFSIRFRLLRASGLLKNAGVYLVANIVQQAMNFLLVPVWVRFLSPEDYGITGTSLAFAGVLTPIFLLGLNASVARQYFSYKSEGDVQRYIRSVSIFQFTWALGLLLIALFAGPFLWPLIAGNQVPFQPYMQLVLISTCFKSILQIPLAWFRARQVSQWYVAIQLSQFGIEALLTAVFIVGLRLGAYGQLLAGMLSAALVLLGTSAFVIRRWISGWPSWAVIRLAVLYGLPLVPHQFATYLNLSFGRIILERFVPLASLGLYNFSYSLSNAVLALTDAINFSWGPYYFEQMESGGETSGILQRMYRLYIAVLYVFFCSGITFAREIFVVLFPQNYFGSLKTLLPLLFSCLMVALYRFAVGPLFYFKQTKLIPMITGGALVLTLILNVWLVPRYGTTAVVWISCVSNLFTAVMAFWLSYRFQQVKFQYIEYTVLGAGTLALVLAATYLPDVSPWNFAVRLSMYFGMLMLTYFLLLKPVFPLALIQCKTLNFLRRP